MVASRLLRIRTMKRYQVSAVLLLLLLLHSLLLDGEKREAVAAAEAIEH